MNNFIERHDRKLFNSLPLTFECRKIRNLQFLKNKNEHLLVSPSKWQLTRIYCSVCLKIYTSSSSTLFSLTSYTPSVNWY